MDTSLLYVLVATGVISLLTLVYVVLDEGKKQRRYAQALAERQDSEAEESPSSGEEDSVPMEELKAVDEAGDQEREDLEAKGSLAETE